MKEFFKVYYALVFFLILSVGNSFAQTGPQTKKDSLEFYKNIQQYSKKHKFVNAIYKKVFRSDRINPPTPAPVTKKSAVKQRKKSYEELNCRVIRSITIEVYDPFGYQLTDTTKKASSIVQKIGNGAHAKSKRISIRNYFLFHTGEDFDAYKISETERLMRQSDLFRDVIIYPSNKLSTDSVDIVVSVIDKFSLLLSVHANPERAKFGITEKNFLGFGHELYTSFDYNKDIYLQAFDGTYAINRIGNTYINAKIIYGNLSDGSSRRALEIERPFYSPITKWAGGITAGQLIYHDAWYFPDTVLSNKSIKSNGLDAFISRSIHLRQTGINCYQTATFQNVILSLRSITNHTLSSGSLGDSLGLYKNRSFVMGMAALSMIDYERDQFLLKFGENEDVPVGNFYGIIGGYDILNGSKYVGFRLGTASLTSHGYLSFYAEAGKYYDYNYQNPSVLKLEATYYSPLLSVANWRFRQFVKPQITFGWNQTINKSLVLSADEGIQGFSSSEVYGFNRASLLWQTQAYAPYNIIGFRFGPVLYFNCGMVSYDQSSIFASKLYSSVGFGILFKNELLVANTFQVSIAFYSRVPDSNSSIKINSFRSVHFDFRDFNIDKPEFVNYE